MVEYTYSYLCIHVLGDQTMKINRTILYIFFILIALVSVASVSASDINNTSLETCLNINNGENIVLEDIHHTDNNINVNSSQSNIIDDENLLSLSLTGANNKVYDSYREIKHIAIISVPNETIRVADLNGLQKDINRIPESSTLDLNNSYGNRGNENMIININRDITIDGHGNTIDFGGRKNCYMDVSANKIIFKNINFINGFNDKSDNGGALYIHNHTDVIFVNCRFSDNFARKSGGAIYSDYHVKIKNCSFNNNIAKKENGGAVYANCIDIFSSTFEGNTADDNGGAVYAVNYININENQNANQSINCYFKNNHAEDNGGALYCKNGDVIVKNALLTGNVAGKNDKGSAIWAKKDIILVNSSYSDNYCDKSRAYELYSKEGHVKPGDNFDILTNVSMTKNIANFWMGKENELKELFTFINKHNPNWAIINITLAPYIVFDGDFNTRSTDMQKFCLYLSGTMIITGNPGSEIKGNGKNVFMYITPHARISLVNLTIRKFSMDFMNQGMIYCYNTIFADNKANIPDRHGNAMEKQQFKSRLWRGSVIHNYGTACFDNCTFDYICKKQEVNAGVLYAESNAVTIFDDCTFKDCKDNFIWALEDTLTVMYQNHKVGKEMKNCLFDAGAILSVISKERKNETLVFNCSNVNELQNVLYEINSLTPNVEEIIINLTPRTYRIDNYYLEKTLMHSMPFQYGYVRANALEVGLIPITINGNGASIILNGVDELGFSGFAYIGPGGILNVINTEIYHFNGVFSNYGELNAIGCTFSGNVEKFHNNHDSVLYGHKSCSRFINCTFNDNMISKEKPSHNMINIWKSYLYMEGCDFNNDNKNVAEIYEKSIVEAPSYLKNIMKFDKSSEFHKTDQIIYNNTTMDYGGTMVIDVKNASNIFNDKNLCSVISDVDPNNLIMNIKEDCAIDLNKLLCKKDSCLVIVGNGHNIVFNHNEKIGNSKSLTLINMSFANYSFTLFDIDGECNFISCNFTGNTGDYLVNNKGICNFINCSITGNLNKKDLVNNKQGSLNFINSTIVGNKQNINNEKGNVYCFNCIFDEKKIQIHNFKTANCEILACENCTSDYDYPTIEAWKLTMLDIGTFLIGMGLSGIGGFLIAPLATSVALTVAVICIDIIAGFSINALAGYIEDLIVAHYTHEHTYTLNTMLIYGALGAFSALAGSCIHWMKMGDYVMIKSGYTYAKVPTDASYLGNQILEYELDDCIVKIIPKPHH